MICNYYKLNTGKSYPHNNENTTANYPLNANCKFPRLNGSWQEKSKFIITIWQLNWLGWGARQKPICPDRLRRKNLLSRFFDRSPDFRAFFDFFRPCNFERMTHPPCVHLRSEHTWFRLGPQPGLNDEKSNWLTKSEQLLALLSEIWRDKLQNSICQKGGSQKNMTDYYWFYGSFYLIKYEFRKLYLRPSDAERVTPLLNKINTFCAEICERS